MRGVTSLFAAVLFGLDDVLRDTEPHHHMTYIQPAHNLSGGTPPDAGEIAGKSNLQLYKALVARFGRPATMEELSQRHFRSVYQLLEGYRVGLTPGLKEALDTLCRWGIPFRVVPPSQYWYVEHRLWELGMHEDAAVVVTGNDGLPLRPTPTSCQTATRVFRPAPSGVVLAVKGSGSGIRSAVAAGLTCMAVYNPGSGAQDLSPIRWRLNSLYELLTLLDGN